MTDLSTADMLRFQNGQKSAGVAYALWFFLGSFGAHRFYLGRPLTGLMQLLLFGLLVLGMSTALGLFAAGASPEAATLPVLAFVVSVAILPIWLLVDLIRLGGMVRRQNDALLERVITRRAS